MATPDLSALTSSSQIFSSTYSLPQIRSLHKSLHAEIDDKAARLRTQVGGSYRELLGTADTIVRMRQEMDAVQATLGHMGGKCGRTVVGAKVTGLARFVKDGEDIVLGHGDQAAGTRGLGVVARARLLEACALAVSRVLAGGAVAMAPDSSHPSDKPRAATRGDRLVIAAKILLLSRRLDMSFDSTHDDSDVLAKVAATRKSLATLKRRLQAGINRMLEKSGESTQRADILKALSAYSLATNSGARDVLWHFLLVRAQAMALAFEMEEDERVRDPQDVLASLQLYTSTLLDVQALIPHRLAEALAALKKDALLADESLLLIEGLRLDVYKRWCGDEIQYFTPFIRHDDLDGQQAREMLSSWAKKGSEVLLQGLRKTLETMTEFKSIVDLRTSVLKLWVSEGGKARGFDPSVMLDLIRKAINTHMLEVLDSKVHKLRLVGSEVAGALEGWHQGVTEKRRSLWDEDSLDAELSSGAAQFAQDVIARLYGRNDAVAKAVTSYTSWYRVIDDVGQIVEQLRKQRWDNDVEEVEDEETIEHRQQQLSKDDPQELIGHLHASLIKAFQGLDSQLGTLWKAHAESPHKGHIAMYFLRILRDIRSKLPDLEPVKDFGLAVVPALHQVVASDVVVLPLREFSTVALKRNTVAGRALWEGDLQLPTSPSPGTFRFLRSLCLSMGDAGGDLWSPAAVAVLKKQLARQLSELWIEALKAHTADQLEVSSVKERSPAKEGEEAEGGKEKKIEKDGEANPKDKEKGNGEAEVEEGGGKEKDGEANADSDAQKETQPKDATTLEQRKDLVIQWLFDIAYLRCALSSPRNAGTNEFKELEDLVYKEAGLTSTDMGARVGKISQEYWKKTSLLFGTLT